ncbi:MAG TPA: hypothetical protein VFT24_13440 [Vicinamibacterales bacterium]|nr:hypothetical protein [Vicinamibacterales bacterium]
MHFSLAQGHPTGTTIRRQVPVVVMMLTLASASSAWAQKVTTVEDLTFEQTLVQLANPLGLRPIGESIGLTTALEIATQPLSSASGGMVFKLDPATGLLTRVSRTLGPSFAERALTAGEGQVAIAAAFSATSYDKLSKFGLNNLPLGSVTASNPANARVGTGDFHLTSKTLTMAGTVGIAPKVDVAVIVPLITATLEAVTTQVDGNGRLIRLAETNTKFSGIGDMAAILKFKAAKLPGPEIPDPGGLGFMLTMRLPTGSRENLRGLGVYRTMASAIFSAGKGPFKPHASGGFEFWSKSVDVPTATATGGLVKVRHQVQFAAGFEIEAHPKVTLLLDFLGQKIRKGGEVGVVSDPVPANANGITSIQSLVDLPEGILKGILVPGIKVNLKGKLLLSLNALVTVKNNGLHSKVTPVVGLNLGL